MAASICHVSTRSNESLANDSLFYVVSLDFFSGNSAPFYPQNGAPMGARAKTEATPATNERWHARRKKITRDKEINLQLVLF